MAGGTRDTCAEQRARTTLPVLTNVRSHPCCVDQPCPFYFDNGTTLIYDRTSVIAAPSLDGPWNATHRTTVAINGSMHPEDPGVYRDQRGNFRKCWPLGVV